MSKLEKIQKEILSLSIEERELVGIFLKDTQQAPDADYHKAWQAELQKRLKEVESGEANLISTKSVIADWGIKYRNEQYSRFERILNGLFLFPKPNSK